MQVTVPLYLPSLANLRRWHAIMRLKARQRMAVHLCMLNRPLPAPPLIVTITRVGPRALDDDNLSAACKYVRDQIADEVGIDDGSPLFTWRYVQRRAREYNVEIEIRAADVKTGR